MFSLALYKDKVCFEIQVFKKNLRCWVSVTETKDTSAIMLTKVGRPFHIETDDILHVYNRGVDKRVVFDTDADLSRFKYLLYYVNNFSYPYSQYLQTLFFTDSRQQSNNGSAILESLYRYDTPLCTVIAYVLMPNHFHLLLREDNQGGISKFMQKLQNAYTRYYNQKNDRSGCLLQGSYKAVVVRSNEQLLHVTRYIHVNPVSASLINMEDLADYEWSSYSLYISKPPKNEIETICEPEIVRSQFRSRKSFIGFTMASLGEDVVGSIMEKLSIDEGFG
ncbi:hypothetical protein CO180_00585 [candidate division WWE3 bacterium CG_4_9_14_3_um_filter_41_6]|uniref:Transposase IS200-like domain-containing protein n=1 Tax=candidate division WWE3 bacterium CG_4_10_14_0_2_um_filter_41_14 TaxID=1975072 RepID=A0A2M7TJV7_UNCKA|nr:MAG: hypothetical protein COY32_02505 [candidate division WWE3 bacterium CG_4_10_14_0_2_um_filter_41_14]PJA39485.1 MAG: hypothetical protein CO180_00585 [candidate division WWE3 bacterium CG_4_9_14_3_um_filter_41_6]